jgi:hypothetical protein
MTSTVSLIEASTVSISLVKKEGTFFYNVLLNFYDSQNVYLTSLTTELTSTSKTKVVISAYTFVRGFYSRVSSKAKIFENGIHVDTVDIQDLLDHPENIQGEVFGSDLLH